MRLNNGVLMPAVGYGTAGLGEGTGQAVEMALRAGYTHLDSVQVGVSNKGYGFSTERPSWA